MAETGRDQEGDDRKVAQNPPEESGGPSLIRRLLLAIPTGLSCALLGMFGGCNIDLVNLRLSDPTRFLLIGAVTGLACGLVIGVRQSRPQAHGMRVLPYDTLLFGAAWLAVSVAGFRYLMTSSSSTELVPVSMPIRLDQAGTVRVSFVARHTSEYSVGLEFKKTLPFEDLVTFTGGWLDEESKNKDKPIPRPEIIWTVKGVRPDDQMAYWKDAYYAQHTVGLKLGRFKAVKNRPYSLTVTVKKPSMEIQVTEPKLEVQLGSVERIKLNTTRIVATLSGLISAAIACGYLFAGVVSLRRAFRVTTVSGSS